MTTRHDDTTETMRQSLSVVADLANMAPSSAARPAVVVPDNTVDKACSCSSRGQSGATEGGDTLCRQWDCPRSADRWVPQMTGVTC